MLMKYAVAFFFFAAALTYLAFYHGGFAFILLWPAAGFLLVAIGYALAAPRVMGKDSTGIIAKWSRCVLLPYHWFVLSVWWMGKTISREAVCAEVAPGIWIGRRASFSELPADVAMIVDLTCEFVEPR